MTGPSGTRLPPSTSKKSRTPLTEMRISAEEALGAGQTADDRRDCFHGAIAHDVVGDALSLAPRAHLVDDVIDRPDEDRRHLEDLIGRDAHPPSLAREALGGGLPLIGEDDGRHHAQLDPVETLARHLPNLLDPG